MKSICNVSVPVAPDGSFNVRELIQHAVRADRRFGSGFDGLRIGQRLSDACAGAADGPLLVETADWEKICEAVKQPAPIEGQPAYPLSPAHVCLPLIEAVLGAADQPKAA